MSVKKYFLRALLIALVVGIFAFGYFLSTGGKVNERFEELKSKIPPTISSSVEKISPAVGEETLPAGEARPLEEESESEANHFLSVFSPKEGETVSSGKVVVSGKTMPGAEVFVNETQVIPDSSGHFQTTIALEEGENFILISAGNENEEMEVERVVYYEVTSSAYYEY